MFGFLLETGGKIVLAWGCKVKARMNSLGKRDQGWWENAPGCRRLIISVRVFRKRDSCRVMGGCQWWRTGRMNGLMNGRDTICFIRSRVQDPEKEGRKSHGGLKDQKRWDLSPGLDWRQLNLGQVPYISHQSWWSRNCTIQWQQLSLHHEVGKEFGEPSNSSYLGNAANETIRKRME